MFAIKSKKSIVIHALLITAVLFNGFPSSLIAAQARQESASLTSPNIQVTEQKASSNPQVVLPDRVIDTENGQTTNIGINPSIAFVENVGQFDPQARFQAQSNDANMYFSEDAIWFTMLEPPAKNSSEDRHNALLEGLIAEQQETRKGVNLKVNLIGSNPHPTFEALNRVATSFSYFAGSDPSNWQSDVPVWGGIRYVDIYPGMDLEITSEQSRPLWQFVVTDASRLYDNSNPVAQQGIRIKIAGHQKLQAQNKNLDILTEVGELFFPAIRINGVDTLPQLKKNDELFIPVPAQISRPHGIFRTVSYKIPSSIGSDSSLSQQANPSTQTINLENPYQQSSGDVLIYSAYFGTKYTLGDAITVDNDGAVYATGNPGWSDFPTGAGVFYLPGASSTSYDTFVAKIDLAANQLIYTAFFKKFGSCGVNWLDGAIAVDNNKNVYVVGTTASTDFPTTTGVIDRQLTDICPSSGQSTAFPADGFILKLNAAGDQLLYSTYLGGSELDGVGGIVVGPDGSAYVAGITYSTDIPKGTQGYNQTLHGPSDIFITKLSPAADQQEFFTYIGGATWESTFGNLKVGSDGSIYVAGMTILQQQCPLPITACHNAFAVKLDPTGNNLIYQTYLGEVGTGYAADLDVDAAGNAYIGGGVRYANFPHTQLIGPGSPSWADGFAVKLSTDGSVVYSTLIGGTRFDAFWAISVDTNGNAYLVGDSSSPDFPLPPSALDTSVEELGQDLIIARLNSSGSQLTYATFLGGSTWDNMSYHGAPLDSNGNLNILVRYTESTDFLTNRPPIGNGTSGSNAFGWNTAAIVRLSATMPVIPYDCSWSLSPIGKAVYNVVVPADKQDAGEVCGNLYNNDSLITLPPGQAAFERFSILAANAQDEIAFATMDWDNDENNENPNDSPGEIFLQGVQELYSKVRQNSENYPGGVHIRILLGRQENNSGEDQRAIVMNDLIRLQIPRTPPDLDWTVEVASYRDEWQIAHSHVKMMMVDGKHVIAAGYNMQYTYFRAIPSHDMGLEISGPIAQRALKVFDGLWVGAHRCEVLNATADGCYDETTIQGPINHHPAVFVPMITGNDPVFSLYRDHDDKTADNAIFAAINAADSEVNILQNRFAPLTINSFPGSYLEAVLNALKKGDGQVSVNLLVSGDWENEAVNTVGICDLWSQLLVEDPFGTHSIEAKLSSEENPIHTKALSIDGIFIVAGSQNWDFSAWGSEATPLTFGDLAEYSLGVDSTAAASEFNTKFWDEWDAANPSLCLGDDTTSAAIQTAINQADPGTTIFIPNGNYTGLITVNKPVVLVGEDPKDTVFQAQDSEPAFRITSSDVMIANLNVSGGTGYGVELIDSSPSSLKDILINRVTFVNNTQGGVLVQGLIAGSPVNYAVENSTFVGGTSGITINMLETQTVRSSVRDNIFSGQSTAPIRVLSSNDGGVEYSYNLFNGCALGPCAMDWHQGNINPSSSEHNNLFDLNPLFVDSANGDYQLSAGSPAIDAGDPSLQDGLYLDGNNDDILRIDIGAFEYVPSPNVAPVVNAGNDQTVNLGSGVTINATYSDEDNPENHSARIDWGDGTIEDVAVNMTGPGAGEVNAQHTYFSIGNYTVEVCVTDLYGGVGCDTVNVEVTSTPNACTPSNSYGFSQSMFQFTSLNLAANHTNFDRLPLSFVPNRGQEDQAVKFQARGLGGNLFFTPGEVVFSLPNPVKVSAQDNEDKEKIRYDVHPANVVRIHYQGANENPDISGTGALPGVVNVLKGNNPAKWRTNLPTYSGIAYRELYPGIELRYDGIDGQLKSTFHVAPGADPSAIVWRYKGADSLSTDESGNLVINLPEPAGNGAVLVEQAPIAWQGVGENRVMVAVQYAVSNNDKKVSFTFPNGYDSTLPLVIDPTLTYSTYLGGGRTEQADAVTLDADCNIYITGTTASSDFPTVDPLQSNQPSSDVFVSKLNAAGNALLYSTYMGGSAGDHAWGIALDTQGRITLVGETESSNFPTLNAYDNTYAGGICENGEPCDDVFVTQLLADGSALRYSTYLGGSSDDEATALALDSDDKIHVTGWTRSNTFPTVNGYDSSFGGGTCSGLPCEDSFVTTIDPALSGTASVVYSTFLGGSNYDKAKSIAADATGRVYVTGYTRSDNYPTLTPYQSARAGNSDIFITKLDTTLSGTASLLYSTYLGGTGSDHAYGIALNGANQVYLTGWTNSTNLPMANAFDNTFGGGTCGSSACHDAFVTYLDIANNLLVYSSYLGGSHEDEGAGITVDDNGNAYVTGYTKSTDFPTLAAIQASKATDSCSAPPCADAFVVNVNATGNSLIYSTYLGGSAEDYGNAIVVDGLGSAYIVGYTYSSDFPTTPGSFPYVGTSSYADAFIVKIED